MSYACAGLRPENIGGYYYCLHKRNIHVINKVKILAYEFNHNCELAKSDEMKLAVTHSKYSARGRHRMASGLVPV